MSAVPKTCSVCDTTEHLQDSHGRGGLNDVCRPCFYIWYDGVGMCRREDHRDQKPHTHAEDVLAYRRKAEAAGTYPFQPGSRFRKAEAAAGEGA